MQDEPGPGGGPRPVESVWDYPRPPRLEPVAERVRVECGARVLADTRTAIRVLETSHPPTYYLPVADIDMSALERAVQTSYCEFKGMATYWSVRGGGPTLDGIAWSYAAAAGAFAQLRDHLAFYAVPELACFVGAERVRAQDGRFYGGWITSWIAGPFKGRPGTEFW